MLREGLSEENIYLWIDFACIDQDNLSQVSEASVPRDILALDYFIQQSDAWVAYHGGLKSIYSYIVFVMFVSVVSLIVLGCRFILGGMSVGVF